MKNAGEHRLQRGIMLSTAAHVSRKITAGRDAVRARAQQGSGRSPWALHGLRHGAASLALAAGTDVKVVSAELGFTQDTYQSVYPDVAKVAAEATAALLRARPVSAG